MAKPAPDRRFDDSPFSGMPSRRVNRRPSEPDDDRSAPEPTPGNGPFSPAPPRRRPGEPRPDDRDTRSRPSASERFDRPTPTPPPPRRNRPHGDGYGDTHADLRWDTDRRLRPAYREGRDYLSPRDDPRDRDTDDERPFRDRIGQGGRPPGRRDLFADPLRATPPRRERDDRRGGPDARSRADDAPDRQRPGSRSGRPVLAEHDRDDGFDGGPPNGTRLVPTGATGPGGRMLAIAGVLFLAVSVVVASVGSLVNGGDDGGGAPNGTEIASVNATHEQDGFGAAPDGTAGADEPLVRFEDQPLPTSTLPPAGQQEQGYAGPWLDGVQTVCIDPGHGGSDRGRTFAGDGDIPPLEEAVLVLEQAMALQDKLRARRFVVVMTRTEDKDVNADGADVNGDGKTIADSDRDGTYDEIQARINVCNRSNADLLISVHLNGFDTGNPSGYESWYTADRPFGTQSGVLAQLGVESLGERMAAEGYTPENRGAKDDGTYSVDDSDPTLAHNMLLTGPEIPGELTPSQMPGVIMESLFITNLDDIAFLRSANANDLIADAFVDAIDGYFSRFAY